MMKLLALAVALWIGIGFGYLKGRAVAQGQCVAVLDDVETQLKILRTSTGQLAR